MDNEYIICLVILAIAAILIFLIQKRNKGGDKKDSVTKENIEAGKSTPKSTPAAKTGLDKEKSSEDDKSLLYIPPELVSADRGLSSTGEDKWAAQNDHAKGDYDNTHYAGDIPKKSKNISDRSASVDLRAEDKDPDGKTTHNETVLIRKAQKNERSVSFYIYRGKAEKWTCLYCEMENPVWTDVCQVCGEMRVKA